MSEELTQEQLALGKICYEEFAEQRMARGANLPSWHPGPLSSGLPPGEREVWARVAQAVREHVTFVITDDVMEAYAKAWKRAAEMGTFDNTRRASLRAAAQAAGFQVVMR